MSMKVTLRRKALSHNRQRLFLDYYPALTNPLNGRKSRFENLKLYVFESPGNSQERKHNRETLALAETIRAGRQIDIQVRLYKLVPGHKREMSFIAYFRKLADQKRGLNWHNWDSSVRYFELFAKEALTFNDIDLSLCNDFKLFLLSKPKIREARRGIGHNTALSYFNKFRTAVKQAWREKLLDNDFMLCARV